MGKGIDLVRGDAPLHAQVLDDFKDQLLIVLIKRLADENGNLTIPLSEMDDTGQDMLAFAVRNNAFQFELRKKS
jgi:hypothetical protein